jgi:hypothetical protein
MIITPNEILMTSPEQQVTLNLTGPTDTVFRVNEDLDWLRARTLLNSLGRKYGKFLIEVSRVK